MNEAILLLKDIVLESQTTSRWLTHGDPVIESLDYIEGLAKRAIEVLETDGNVDTDDVVEL